MSRIRADKLVNRGATGAPTLTYGAQVVTGMGITGAGGINISGVCTAADFSGPGQSLSGIVTSGATASSQTIAGNVTVGGNFTVQGTQTTIDSQTLSVEDSNIGIGTTTTPSNATADGGGITIFGGQDGDKTLKWVSSTDRWTFAGTASTTTGGTVAATAFKGSSEIGVSSAGTWLGAGITAINFTGAGNTFAITGGTCDITIDAGDSLADSGINTSTTTTFHSLVITGGFNVSAGIHSGGNFIEDVSVIGTALTGEVDLNLADQTVYHYTANASGDWTWDLWKSGGSISLNDLLATGQPITMAAFVPQGGTAYHPTDLKIANTSVWSAVKWLGGAGAPNAGTPNATNYYTFTIIKTAANTYTVFGNQSVYDT